MTPQDVVQESLRIGLTGVVLSEHWPWRTHEFNEFVSYAKDHGVVIVRGLEVKTEYGHILTFGLHEYSSGISSIAELRRVMDRKGGFMIIAHPFRFLFDVVGVAVTHTNNILFPDPATVPTVAEEAVSHPIFTYVDEIEVVNGGNSDRENAFSRDVAKLLGRKGTGGSDAHSKAGFAKGVTILEGDIRDENDFIAALWARVLTPGEGFHIGQLQYFGDVSEKLVVNGRKPAAEAPPLRGRLPSFGDRT
ncbi:MAG: PHP domain-containing protein [Chloroflexi bacterium]|nr:PHP domain-containing protein [Chloroflexota bacterium]